MTERITDLDGVDDDAAVDGASGGANVWQPPAGTDQPASERPTTPSPDRRVTWWQRHRERRRNRVSKWDRPPEPHDWRFFVGSLGKVLIATGVLMFGFVAYQLWGTGIETARAQNRLEDAFESAIATSAEEDPTDDSAAPTVPPTQVAEQDPDPDDDPVAEDPVDDPTDEPLPELPEPVPSAIVPGGVDLSDVAVDQNIPAIDRGDVVARLEIPRIDQDLFVVAGVTLDDLKDGPGHYPDTPLPGQLGNAAIAGHRTTYGAPFFDVDQLTAGDQLIVTVVTGDRFVYEVTGVEVVSASDYWVVTTRDPDVAELTLTSCHPKYTARERIVVHSVLVPELSANVGVAEFYDVDDVETEAIPADDPTVTQEESAGDIVGTVDPDAGNDLVGDEQEPVSSAVEPVDAPADEPAVGGSDGDTATTTPVEQTEPPSEPEPAAVDDPEQLDAFSQGWFDDDEAWPQIALWGLALTIISLLAYQVSKKTRHDSIGFLAGIAPFLFCLYFFFQNVNRLLPPGL